ncbi:MAG: hypothetical protein NT007_06230 [Candidatus Kapabacteria bacterium]|nr:hypothetical protein [Candidatus Kapabacteria bacterium]
MKNLLFFLLLAATIAANAQIKYTLPCNSALLKRSGEIAIAQIGTQERTGHNDGYNNITNKYQHH